MSSGAGLRSPRLRVSGARRADSGHGGGEQLVLGERVRVGVGLEHDGKPHEQHRSALGDGVADEVLDDRLIALIECGDAVFDAVLVRLDDRLAVVDAERADEKIRAGSSASVATSSTQLNWSSLVSPVPFLAWRISLTRSAKHLSFPRRRNIAPQSPSAIESPTKAI